MPRLLSLALVTLFAARAAAAAAPTTQEDAGAQAPIFKAAATFVSLDDPKQVLSCMTTRDQAESAAVKATGDAAAALQQLYAALKVKFGADRAEQRRHKFVADIAAWIHKAKVTVSGGRARLVWDESNQMELALDGGQWKVDTAFLIRENNGLKSYLEVTQLERAAFAKATDAVLAGTATLEDATKILATQ